LCAQDGPYGPVRRWTQQFYPPLVTAPSASAEAADELAVANAALEAEHDYPDAGRQIGVEDPRPEATAPAASAEPAEPVTRDAIRESILERIPSRFVPNAAGDRSFVVQYSIAGSCGGDYYVEVRDRQCSPAEGRHPEANVEVKIKDADWLDLNRGRLDAGEAFVSGRLSIGGDLKLGMLLATVFPL
jgi:putative sterol carrier protein